MTTTILLKSDQEVILNSRPGILETFSGEGCLPVTDAKDCALIQVCPTRFIALEEKNSPMFGVRLRNIPGMENVVEIKFTSSRHKEALPSGA